MGKKAIILLPLILVDTHIDFRFPPWLLFSILSPLFSNVGPRETVHLFLSLV